MLCCLRVLLSQGQGTSMSEWRWYFFQMLIQIKTCHGLCACFVHMDCYYNRKTKLGHVDIVFIDERETKMYAEQRKLKHKNPCVLFCSCCKRQVSIEEDRTGIGTTIASCTTVFGGRRRGLRSEHGFLLAKSSSMMALTGSR